MADQTIDVRIQAVLDGFAENLASANAEVQTTVAEMKEGFASLGESVELLSAGFLAFTAVLAGGAAFKEVVSATTEWTGEVVRLSRQLGLSTEEASGLAMALHHVGLSSDEYATYVQKLTRQMRTNSQAYEANGISIKDQNGEWKNSQDVMVDVVAKLASTEAGTNRNVLASALLGARVGDLGKLLRLNSEVMEEGRLKAVQYGMVVGPDGAAQAKQYTTAMRDVGEAWEGLKVFLGNQLLPTLTELATWFNQNGPESLLAFRKGLAALEIDGTAIGAVLDEINAAAVGLGTTLHFVLQGNWAGAKAGFAAIGQEMDAISARAQLRLDAITAQIKDAEDRVAHPENHLENGTRGKGGTVGGDDFKKGGNGKDPKKEELETFIAAEREKEEAAKDNTDEIIRLRESVYNKAVELFGAESKEAYKAGKDLLAARRQLTQEALADGDAAIKSYEGGELAQIEIARSAVALKKQLGQESATDLLAEEQGLADQVYQVKRDALEHELELYANEPKKVREINAQILALQQQFSVQLAQEDNAMTAEIAASWQGVEQVVGQAASGMFTGFLTGSQTFLGTMGQMADGFVKLWADAIAKTVEHWVAGEVAKTGITAAESAKRVLLDAAAIAESLAKHAAAALVWIATEGAKAAASAWTSVSAIPLVGWLMGPAVAAATLAGVVALGSKVASASGGYDIPAGVNPMTQLHAQEMVLPAHLANPLRDLLASGGGSGMGGGAPIHVHAMDAQSFVQFAKRNPEGFAHGVNAAVRAGHLKRA